MVIGREFNRPFPQPFILVGLGSNELAINWNNFFENDPISKRISEYRVTLFLEGNLEKEVSEDAVTDYECQYKHTYELSSFFDIAA